jgi:glycerol kinase
MPRDLLLAIDEGTSSARAIAYDRSWTPVASAARRLETAHPRAGWAEQDANAILAAVVDAVGEVLESVGGAARIAATGIANQGESVVAWDAATGTALGPVVLWSCRRSAAIVERLAAAGHGPEIQRRTGLPLDPYFSASKIRWLIEEVPAVARAAESGRLAAGTVDAWLTASLGGVARTDPSTASRTQLTALAGGSWDAGLADLWGVPRAVLPTIGPTVGDLGTIGHPAWGGDLPLRAMACDQQAALAGQGGHRVGTIKATFGTGVFVLANVGSPVPVPPPGILATVAWSDASGRLTYALDGGVFSAGALLDWLARDLRVLDAPASLDDLAGRADDAAGIRVLPALSGLGAPWWEPDARVVIAGLSAATGRAHLARAAIDAIAHRTVDIVEAMDPALVDPSRPLRVDGGLMRSGLLVQRLADLAGRPVEVATDVESTALGTAVLAALGAGWIDEAAAAAVAGTARSVQPAMAPAERRTERAAWTSFVRGALALSQAARSPA